MIVVTLTDCPPRLRGDLSKWLIEINTGVYVGRASARVRDELWKRICDHLPNGRATMVYSTNNEQRMAFRLHNTSWETVDYDGLILVRRPLPKGAKPDAEDSQPQSKAAAYRQLHGIQSARARKRAEEGYVVIDVETTGLNAEEDEIIEIAAVRIVENKPTAHLAVLVRPARPIPANIASLTGITQQMVDADGVPLEEAIGRFRAYVGDSPIISHNIAFDRAFLSAAYAKTQSPPLRNVCKDTLSLARRRVDDAPNFRLATLAAHLGIQVIEPHRALADCLTTYLLYEKLLVM